MEQQTNYEMIHGWTQREMAQKLLPLIEMVTEDGIPCEEWFERWLGRPAEPEEEWL